MTVLNAETPPVAPTTATQPDSNLAQQNVESNLSQEKENKNEESTEDPNWRAFREARKKDRAEREAAERKASEREAEVAALKAAMEAAFSKPTPNQPAYNYDNESEETEDQRIEKKVNAIIASKEKEAQMRAQQLEQQQYPQRLKQVYPDFNQVISQENLDYLDYHYPEVSRPLQRLGEGFDKWSDIYQAVKKFIPNHSNSKKEAAKAEANFSKPKSMSSVGLPQPGDGKAVYDSRDLEARRQARYMEMQKIIKSI